MLNLKITLFVAFQFLLVEGCVSSNSDVDSSESLETALVEKTIIPKKFSSLQSAPSGGKKIVPIGLIDQKVINRPRTQFREGPGVQFSLKDDILENGYSVVEFGKLGVWRRIYVPRLNQKGWVHYKTLADEKKLANSVELPVDALPTVIAMNQINSVFSYPKQKKLKVDIAKGTIFRALKYSDNSTLVLINNTNSVMWVSSEDVK